MRNALCLMKIALLSAVAGLVQPVAGFAQTNDPANWSVAIGNQYRLVPDITYLVADGYESKLDLVLPSAGEPRPTLLYFHGGGWVGGSKEVMLLRLLPYVEMGWAVVNVEYRMASVALAPAAVEDCRCALRWVRNNAEKYGFDVDKIVVSGHSAGGHLSLTTGTLPAAAGLDRRCPARDPDGIGRAAAHDEEMSVAAIINWYGITDVGDLLSGVNAKTYAVNWMAGLTDRMEIAKRVSPLTYIRPGLPPVLTIHGNADSIVPYDHAVRLHEALDKAGVVNQLHTVEGGGHGRFSTEQMVEAFDVIRVFLAKHVTGE